MDFIYNFLSFSFKQLVTDVDHIAELSFMRSIAAACIFPSAVLAVAFEKPDTLLESGVEHSRFS